LHATTSGPFLGRVVADRSSLFFGSVMNRLCLIDSPDPIQCPPVPPHEALKCLNRSSVAALFDECVKGLLFKELSSRVHGKRDAFHEHGERGVFRKPLLPFNQSSGDVREWTKRTS